MPSGSEYSFNKPSLPKTIKESRGGAALDKSKRRCEPAACILSSDGSSACELALHAVKGFPAGSRGGWRLAIRASPERDELPTVRTKYGGNRRCAVLDIVRRSGVNNGRKSKTARSIEAKNHRHPIFPGGVPSISLSADTSLTPPSKGSLGEFVPAWPERTPRVFQRNTCASCRSLRWCRRSAAASTS